jgi:hypothetical protein
VFGDLCTRHLCQAAVEHTPFDNIDMCMKNLAIERWECSLAVCLADGSIAREQNHHSQSAGHSRQSNDSYDTTRPKPPEQYTDTAFAAELKGQNGDTSTKVPTGVLN